MGRTDHIKPTSGQIDDVAWQFLRSEFTGSIYADWPIDRRWLHDDGSAYSALLDRVMDNIAPAVRIGVLASAEELTS
uniref:Uncharacterized protein n=1 Tax=Mycobacterium sp. (strain JLS) TaxID=164757 RepID=A0A5Q5CCN6_MYCSJ